MPSLLDQSKQTFRPFDIKIVDDYHMIVAMLTILKYFCSTIFPQCFTKVC